MNLAPNSVSWRVVKTSSSSCAFGVVEGSSAKRMSRPSERPIQLRCITRTFSGQRSSRSSACSKSSENFVMRKYHCGISRCATSAPERSEEHTSELQSRQYLVCRLLLEKKKEKH